MDNLPYLNLSPAYAKLSKSVVSNPKILTKTQPKLNPSIDQIPDYSNNRISSTPKRSRYFMVNKEINRLEEELDKQEININNRGFKFSEDEKFFEKDLKAYESCIQAINNCVSQIDSRTGKCLSRAWLCYQKTLEKQIKAKDYFINFKNSETSDQAKKNTFTKDSSIQTNEELSFDHNHNEFEEYILILNNVKKKSTK